MWKIVKPPPSPPCAATNGCRPYHNLGGPRSRVAVYVITVVPFFASLVKGFPATLVCSDGVYDDISCTNIFITVRFGWNLLHRLILECDLRRLYFYLLHYMKRIVQHLFLYKYSLEYLNLMSMLRVVSVATLFLIYLLK